MATQNRWFETGYHSRWWTGPKKIFIRLRTIVFMTTAVGNVGRGMSLCQAGVAVVTCHELAVHFLVYIFVSLLFLRLETIVNKWKTALPLFLLLLLKQNWKKIMVPLSPKRPILWVPFWRTKVVVFGLWFPMNCFFFLFSFVCCNCV